MKIIKVNLKDILKKDVELIARYFKSGKAIIYPTDTIYGMGCDAINKKAVERVRKIKRRDKDKPFVVLVNSWRMLHKYFYVSKKQNQYLRKIWFFLKDKKMIRPITVLLKKKNSFPPYSSPKKESVAVRLPNNDFLIKIIKEIGRPIVSTSVNLSGENHLTSINEIKKYFKGLKPDLAVDANKKLNGKPSKLIDLINIEDIKILRK